ncbi:MAG: pyridoxal phosphate-dependent aminotransferase, partial [Betaproteobacteria bacterium]|nr:pyridoxal phosphate-dependent aminotransferase [Betaproteobacteria bacterium]
VVEHLRACRDTLVPALAQLPGLEVASLKKAYMPPKGLGLAPGNAFAPEAQGWLRWCFASHDLDRLRQGVGRLAGWLQQGGPGKL